MKYLHSFFLTGLTCDILPEEGCIKLRGSKRHVEKGIDVIGSFVINNYFVDILCTEDDFSTVFQQATGVRIFSSCSFSYKPINNSNDLILFPLTNEHRITIERT